jgi:hypothetical protein
LILEFIKIFPHFISGDSQKKIVNNQKFWVIKKEPSAALKRHALYDQIVSRKRPIPPKNFVWYNFSLLKK